MSISQGRLRLVISSSQTFICVRTSVVLTRPVIVFEKTMSMFYGLIYIIVSKEGRDMQFSISLFLQVRAQR